MRKWCEQRTNQIDIIFITRKDVNLINHKIKQKYCRVGSLEKDAR